MGVTSERYGGFNSMPELEAVVADLKEAGINAYADYSGQCRHTNGEHWHPNYVSVRGLTPQQARKLLNQSVSGFTKVVGGWLFETGGVKWIAHHNQAGFGGRDWELWSVNVKGDRAERVVADMLPSRAACVERAEEYMRD